MAAIRVKPFGHGVKVQSVIPSTNEISKAKKCLFGRPERGETDKLFNKEQAKNIEILRNFEFVEATDRVGSSEGSIKTIKRSGSPLMTDHFKKTKKVCKTNRPNLIMTTKEQLRDEEEQCTTETCEIGSTNFVTNIATVDAALEADAIRADEPLSPTHQQNQEQSQQEVSLHIMVTNHAGKFS